MPTVTIALRAFPGSGSRPVRGRLFGETGRGGIDDLYDVDDDHDRHDDVDDGATTTVPARPLSPRLPAGDG